MFACAVSSSSARSRMPTLVAPGSRVVTTSKPCSRSQMASIRAWVVLPAPSPPSSAMNRPWWAGPVTAWSGSAAPGSAG